jgi:hypothetical protein
MSDSTWLDDVPVLGMLPPDEAAAALRAMGEPEVADVLERSARVHITGGTYGLLDRFFGPGKEPIYMHTAHTYGYLAPSAPGDGLLDIRQVGNIAADASLKNGRVVITLDRLRVAKYPGGGEHQVLFTFETQNHLPGNSEDLHFGTTFRVREGERAGLISYPIFDGLHVATKGVRLKCRTVNVTNSNDQSFLDFLNSDVFNSGLKLATTFQPALAPLSGMVLGIARSLLKRDENRKVQDIDMGLNFSSLPGQAHLAEGEYVVVQIPEKFERIWDWSEWAFDPLAGEIVSRADTQLLIPYNFIMFGISRYDGD